MNIDAEIAQGVALGKRGQLIEAEAIFRRLVASHPQSWSARHNLGVALQVQERHAEAVHAFGRAIELAPNQTSVRHSLALSLLQLQRPAEAIDACRAALRVNPDNAEVHGVLAEALLMSGDFKRGWAEYEWRWKCGTFKEERRNLARPRWRGAGERVADKTIFIASEQGFGDVIQFVRYAPLLAERGAEVIVQSPAELLDVVRRMRGVSMATTGQPAAFDLYVPLMSLPLAFGTTVATIPANVPYLSAAGKAVDVWGARLGEKTAKLRVGLAWTARQDSARGRRKSVPLEKLARLATINEGDSDRKVSFLSLQKSATPIAAPPSLELLDFPNQLNDFSDAAAIIANCDLVICVDTAIAHLAGAMGKTVWVMLAYGADFRWLLGRSDSPWYPTMRLFRQPSPGDWDAVMDQILAELRQV